MDVVHSTGTTQLSSCFHVNLKASSLHEGIDELIDTQDTKLLTQYDTGKKELRKL